MPKLPVREFRETGNAAIINAIRNDPQSDYLRRIPAATKSTISDTISEMMNYAPARNEFLNGFVNKIGLQIAKTNSWTNPFAPFKLGMLSWGDTIEEHITGLIQSQVYDPSRDYLEKDVFGQAVPQVGVSYHKVNRQSQYKITVNESMLRRAFMSDTGLSDLAAQIMESPTTSDNWDEFVLMSSLFRENYDNNGYFKVQSPDVANAASEQSDAKTLLRLIREYTNKMEFISTHYNAARFPVSAQRDKLMLITTPAVDAALDVEALAWAFNLPLAEVQTRKIAIPEEHMRIAGAQAILTTEDFFMVADTYFDTAAQINPSGRYTNYFLHHDQVISLSRFVPSVLFTTEKGDVIEITDPEPDAWTGANILDGITFEESKSGIRGEYLQVIAYPTDAKDKVLNVGFDIRLAPGDANIPLDPKTSVDANGSLFISESEKNSKLTVSLWYKGEEVGKSVVAVVEGDSGQSWPVPSPAPVAKKKA